MNVLFFPPPSLYSRPGDNMILHTTVVGIWPDCLSKQQFENRFNLTVMHHCLALKKTYKILALHI